MLSVILLVLMLGVLVPVLSRQLATEPRRRADDTHGGDGASAGILGGDSGSGGSNCGDGGGGDGGGGDGGCD